MGGLFRRLRERSLPFKLLGLLIYGIVTFVAIYATGITLFENIVFFRVFEFLWFAHILIICYQIQRNQTEMFLLAVCGLLPGIVHNLLTVFTLQTTG